MIEFPQEVLTPPVKQPGQTVEQWRDSYRQSRDILVTGIRSQPGNCVYRHTDPNPPVWLKDPKVITLVQEDIATTVVPAFQIGADGWPIDLVCQVNIRLGWLYDHIQGPWGDRQLSALVWWLKIHPALGVPPAFLIGTLRQSELSLLAFNPVFVH